MKYGLNLPNFGPFGEARFLANLAKEAELAGWDGFFIWDHILFGPVSPIMVDPWIALTAVAMNTEKIQFGTIVSVPPRRRPWKLARETVTLARLSGGRLILGAGSGDPAEWEFGFFGEETDLNIRAQKLDESLDILKGLWSGKPFHYDGIHYHLKEMVFNPSAEGQIPIWIGGSWPKKPPMRRAARYNGVVPYKSGSPGGQFTPDEWRDILAYIKKHRTDDSPFDAAHTGGVTPGNPAEGARMVAPYQEVGVTWWLEEISPARLKWNWDEWMKPWPLDDFLKRIKQGPPRIA